MSSAQRQQPTIVYPRFPAPLDEATIKVLFTPRPSQLEWALSTTRSGSSRVWLLTLLKSFEILGYFPAPGQVSKSVLQHVASVCGIQAPDNRVVAPRTLYRNHRRVRKYLGISAWNGQGRRIAQDAMESAAQVRLNPADLINAAIEALVQARYELPALSLFRRLAGTVSERNQSHSLSLVHKRLSTQQRSQLDALLVVTSQAEWSPFGRLCQHAGSVTRTNVKQLIERLHLLPMTVNAEVLLAGTAAVKVEQWADEAIRLSAAELREYHIVRRRVLLLCLVHRQRAKVLDDLCTVFIRTVRKLKYRATTLLQQWLNDQHRSSEQLLLTFSAVLQAYKQTSDPAQCYERVGDCLDKAGGVSRLLEDCEARLHHRVGDWRTFLAEPFRSQRTVLLNILAELPLRSVSDENSLIDVLPWVLSLRSWRDEWVALDIDDRFLGRYWSSLVCHSEKPGVYNRRTLECAVLFELVAGLRAGDLYVEGSAHFGNYSAELFAENVDERAVTSAFRECGLPDTASAWIEGLKASLRGASRGLELAISEYSCVELNDKGLPIIPRTLRQTAPPSVDSLTRRLDKRLPERGILEALYNTNQWASWTRHFGPPSRLATQMDDPTIRYVLTTFAYGCGLGPTQAAKHLDTSVPEHVLRFINRRHISVDDLRAACSDLINLYAQFDLPGCWGPAQAAGADGSLVETYADNLFAQYHVRYRRSGGIAYRHIADNYVALFSQFIVCGVHEAVYILDGILKNRSDVRPNRLHADSHGQSEAVFGLAYLLGIELMPRIRNWRTLRLYSADANPTDKAISGLYSAAIDWDLIASHWEVYGRLVIAIRSGRLTASTILARLNSYSRRNPLYRALQELGRVVRTIYLLDWINDEELRGQVTRTTNKVESFHAFAAYLNFGSAGVSTTNNPAEQEKRVIYNQLVCNAVMLQNVADQTRVLNSLQEEGKCYAEEDLGFLSPYGTRHWKRFGEYRTEHMPEATPDTHMRTTSPDESI